MSAAVSRPGDLRFVAYPAEYGVTGVMTFIVDQDRMVFQKDLGDATKDPGPLHEPIQSRLQLGEVRE